MHPSISLTQFGASSYRIGIGNEKIETRLGAIYTLERIAKDSKDDHWTIMEVLTAFARENTPVKKDEEKLENTKPLINYWMNYKQVDKTQHGLKIRIDIQAVLTVIGRRNCNLEEENQRLDLSNIDINGLDLTKCYLERVDFILSNLEGTILRQAKLANAYLNAANLRCAVLCEADLQKVDLSGAELQQANFYRTNLQRAFLQGANLYMTNLSEAKLQGANLKKTKNLEQYQIEMAYGDEKTELPDNLQRPEHWK